MPVIAAIVGAVMTGLLYWFLYGNGMAALDRTLSDRRHARLRAQSEARFRSAPLRAIKDPADAAGVPMRLVALARGTPTPEQASVIEAEMRKITPPGDDLSVRLAYIQHAAAQAENADVVLNHLAPLLGEKLDASERNDLERMMETVALVHQGPTEAQQRLISRTVRVLAEEH